MLLELLRSGLWYLEGVFALCGHDVEEDVDVHLDLAGSALLAGLIYDEFERFSPI